MLSSLPVQATAHPQAKLHVPDLHDRLRASRQLSLALAAPLSDEDQTVQPMDDASPTKWHLAHTTWFYESFILKPHLPDYREFSADFEYCFNSYYESKGERQPRGQRGLLTRPSAAQVRAYRAHVDEALTRLFTQGFVDEGPDPLAVLIELGINHEQQHQELLLTDILSLFAANPLRPAYRDPAPKAGAGRRRRRTRSTSRSKAASAPSATTAPASPTTTRARATRCCSIPIASPIAA